jgi:hypothetical protein
VEDVLEMEGMILKALDFMLIGPSSNRFFTRKYDIDLDEKAKLLS